MIKGWLVWINIVFFFFSISFVRKSYKTIWLKTWSWYKTQWNLEGLKSIFSKRCASKSERGQWGPIKKNSTPSPWKRRKTTSSAIFCATSAWGLTVLFNLNFDSTTPTHSRADQISLNVVLLTTFSQKDEVLGPEKLSRKFQYLQYKMGWLSIYEENRIAFYSFDSQIKWWKKLINYQFSNLKYNIFAFLDFVFSWSSWAFRANATSFAWNYVYWPDVATFSE